MSNFSLDASNPFSTRFVRPGAIEYLFPEGWSAERIIVALSANGWRGSIVGPHGSGKSSLLATLIPLLKQRGVLPYLISLHDKQRWLPHVGEPLRDSQSRLGEPRLRVLVIDGYEQLNRLSRWLVPFRCRNRGWGLLVTAHQNVSLPTIFETSTSLMTFEAIVAQLLPPHVAILTSEDVAAAYANSAGNLRESLFHLYDRYAKRADESNRRPLSSVETA